MTTGDVDVSETAVMVDSVLGRKYALSRSENFGEFLRKVGVNFVARQLLARTGSEVRLTKEGDEYVLRSRARFRNALVKFRQGAELLYRTADGRTVQSVFEIDGNAITEVQNDGTDRETTIVRTFTPEEVHVTIKCDDVTALRVYKAVNKD